MNKVGAERALRELGSTLLVFAVTLAATSCAPRHSRVDSVKTVTGSKPGKGEAQPQPVAVLASTNELGIQIAAHKPLECPTWLIETGDEERERVNSVNGVVLTLEWVAAVAALGAGGVVTADAFLEDDAERRFESFGPPEAQQIIGGATVGVGLVLGVVALVDSLAARDEKLVSRTFEREKANSRKEGPCGQEVAASLAIQLQFPGLEKPHALGTTDANGKLELQWQTLPSSLFENRQRAGDAQLMLQDVVAGTISLEAGWDVHANAAWEALPAGQSEALAAFHIRFPGAREDQSANKEETTRQLAAFEAALQANEVGVARKSLEALKARVEAQVIAEFEKRLGVLEASLGKEQALTRAKEAVAKLSESDAGAPQVVLAKMALQRARDLGVDAFDLGATEQSFAKSRDAIVSRKTKEALTLEATAGLLLLRELQKISEGSKAVEKAFSRVTSKALRTGLKAVKTLTRQKDFDAALSTLASLEELVGANAKVDKERATINKAQSRAEQQEEKRLATLARKEEQAEKTRLAAEARAAAKAAKLEERRLAAEASGEKKAAARLARQQAQAEAAAKKVETKRLAAAAAKLEAEERESARNAKREEAKRVAAAKAAEKAAQRAAAKATTEEKRAAAKAAADEKRAASLARQEAKKLAKAQARLLRRQKQEEAKRRRLGLKGGVSKQAPIASYLEFELDKSLAKADALTSLILPAGCQAKVTNVVATPPACPGCKATAMRRVQLSCPQGSVDFLKSDLRVWARCLTSSCAACQELTTGSMSNLAVSNVVPKLVRSCPITSRP
jgi:hypothetical protein